MRKEKRMSEKLIKMTVSSTAAMLSVYFHIMLVPVVILAVSMAMDYLSGVVAAWFSGTLNSKTGKHGAIKKVCYMLLVVTAGIIDWVICYGLSAVGLSYDVTYYFGLLVTVWLILNELLSILENCTIIGIPIPGFMQPIAKRLKIMVEEGSAVEDSTGSSAEQR